MAEKRWEGVEFISDQERAYFEEAKFGEDVRTFLVSNVGRYLHGRARIQLLEAQDELVRCAPEELMDLQAKAKQAEIFMSWLAEAISNGDLAYQTLKEYRE